MRALGNRFVERRRVGDHWHVVAADGDEDVVAIVVSLPRPQTLDDFFTDPVTLVVKRRHLVDMTELEAWMDRLKNKKGSHDRKT